MRTIIEDLAGEAEQQIRDRVWDVAAVDRAIAAKAAGDLSTAVGPPHVQEALPVIDRLARLREALAALALSLAHVHGRLAWFLGAACTALTPVLHWRALAAEDGPTFGAVQATAQQYEDAEHAVRRLCAALTHITTG
ncbi:hypothetical protein AB0953_31525 [Streptomyces sp. NPDC046866]|uniref:hypothetical protein n=1 Tax=Streptomyces sp. NPDC046866 TaxID=3154921 RepID=UPI0034523A09